ncbi:MAG TPA: 50S ribosomal protein L25 [Candidatus Paceibacterota bacterium]
MFSLQAQSRTSEDTVAKLSQEGRIPAVCYGQGQNIAISVSQQEVSKLYQKAGSASVVTITVDGQTKDTLIKDISRDPVSHLLRHVDFLIVDKNKVITVTVPLTFTGEAPAEKDGLGNAMIQVHEVEVECTPANLPSSLEIDLSVLDSLESSIKAGDIKLPAGVTLVSDADQAIAVIAEHQKEVEEVEFNAEAIGDSVTKGKKDETEE